MNFLEASPFDSHYGLQIDEATDEVVRGRRFKRVIGSGRFGLSGSRLTFHSGPMRSMYAIVKTERKFGVWVKGERYYSYYCYLNN